MAGRYALITGASQGIGKAIALNLAGRGFNLLLVARSAEKLEALQGELSSSHGVAVHYLVADLSDAKGIQKLNDWVIDTPYPISVLVNNAGYGLWGAFDSLSLYEQQNMIDLNVKSLTSITHHLIPVLRQQPKAYILNVASVAAYQAVPTLAVYAASKAYVLFFSRALRHELSKEGIVVSSLNPGPVDTGFPDRAGMQALRHLTDKYNMDAQVVADAAIRGLFRGKSEIVPGALNKFTAFGNRLLPKAWVERIAAGLYNSGKRDL